MARETFLEHAVEEVFAALASEALKAVLLTLD
jgi:hypothetical protein